MKAEDLMTRTVLTCSPDDSLEQAARVMWESDVGCLVVMEDGQTPIAMITDRDIAMAAYTQGVALRDARVESAMSKRVLTCSVPAALGEIESTMRSGQVRRLPVVDSNRRLMGIVTLADIARSTHTSPLGITEVPGLARTLASITKERSEAAAAQ